jgi:hypothetical protein
LEAALRHLTVALVLIGTLGLSGPSLARDLYLGKHTPDELKTVCAKAGGRFSQDSGGYGCGTDCHGSPGTDCTVYCKAGKRCVAQVIGGRRPRQVESALKAPPRH